MHNLPVEVPQIQLRDLAGLIPYARNSRTHSPEQVQQLKALLLEFGWTNAVLVDAEGIVAGHGRCMAAAELYADGKQIRFPGGALIPVGMVPTLDCSGWSAEQRRAYIIADNRSALSAGWDEEALALELRELEAAGYDLSLTAFDDVELEDLLGGVGDDDGAGSNPDDAPSLPETPVSQRGDVWLIGDHRVMCGSSTDPDDWTVLMAGELADVVWTDPPYNVDIGGKNDQIAKAQGRRNKTGAILNDKMGDSEFYTFLLAMYQCVAEVMRPGAPIYVFHADSEGINFRTAFRDAGFKLQSVLQWRKNSLVLSRWDHQPISEPCLYGWKPGAGHQWYGGRKQTTFAELHPGSPFTRQEDGSWSIVIGDEVFVVEGNARVSVVPSSIISEPRPAKSDLHPTMKPVGLIERQLRNSARRGEVVVDAFGGSGSTAVAAHRLAMKSRLMELDPKYVDVIVRRLEMFTGLRAVHAKTGEWFPATGEDRAPLVPEPADHLADVF